MTRAIRNALYLVLGLLFGGAVTLAHAETIAATTGGITRVQPWLWYDGKTAEANATQDGDVVCKSIWPTYSWTVGTLGCSYQGASTSYVLSRTCKEGRTFSPSNPGGFPLGYCEGAVYSCPASGGWTLSGNQCTRPDCEAGQTRDGNGVCVATCPAGFHDDPAAPGQCIADCIGEQVQQANGQCACAANNRALVSFSTGGGSSGPAGAGCVNGCVRSLSAVSVCPGAVVAVFTGGAATCYGYATTTGATCGSNTTSTAPPIPVTVAPPLPPADTSGTNAAGTAPDPLNTATNAADPVACANAGGSFGTVNGVSKCLAPSAGSPKLVVSNDEAVTKAPDGTTTRQQRQTISVDPGDGGAPQVVRNVQSTVTGPDGTVIDSGSTQVQADQPAFCEANPNSPICKAADDECKQHPERIGCLTLGTVDDSVAVGSQAVGVSSITPVAVASNNTCPAPIALPVGELSWQPICDGLGWLKPLVLALAWLGAFYIVFPAARSS